MRSLLRMISALRLRHCVVFVIASVVLGQALNQVWPFQDIWLYQLLFIPAIVIAFYEVAKFVEGVERFRSIIASHPNSQDAEFIISLLNSYWYFSALVLVGGLFVFTTIELRYVRIDPTGMYALGMIFLVMVSAVLGQLCYLYYILILRRLSRGKMFKYNFFLPARTNWVRLLDEMGNRLTNAFFVLGFIYTLVYFLNLRPGYMSLSWHPFQISISTPNDVAFVLSWVVLFLIIVIAFPCYVWSQSTYMRAIVRTLKDISIEEVHFLASGDGDKEKRDKDGQSNSYKMMMDIDASAPVPSERFNPIPYIATFSSLAVHLIKISESM